MAIDKRLKIYDDQGHDVDYDIMADDVKFSPDGKDLPTKLAEMEEEIGEGGYTPPAGGIPKTDLASDVQTSLDKADTALQQSDKTALQAAITSLQNALNTLIGGNVQGAIDTFNEVTAFLNGIDTSDPTLKNQLLALNTAITNLGNSLATVATSGSYNDLSNKPTILSQQQVAGMIEDAIEDMPTGGIPTKVSELDNDEGYIKASQMDNAPTAGSNNPVKSGGIKTAIDQVTPTIDANGKWVIGGVATDKDAQGPRGNTVLVNENAQGIQALIVNNVVDGGEDEILSAEMGKVIRQNIMKIFNALGTYAFPEGKPVLNWGSTVTKHSINVNGVTGGLTISDVEVDGTSAVSLPAQIADGKSLSLALNLPSNLHVFDDGVTIMMGGVNITNNTGVWDESTGEINIDAVMGDIVITAAAITYVGYGETNSPLVFNLDGKNRGGVEGHWTDMAGNVDFALTNCTENNDNVQFNGNSKGVSNGTLNVLYSAGSIESIFDVSDSEFPTYPKVQHILTNNVSNGISMGLGFAPLLNNAPCYCGINGIEGQFDSTEITGIPGANNTVKSKQHIYYEKNSCYRNEQTQLTISEGTVRFMCDNTTPLSIGYRGRSLNGTPNEQFLVGKIFCIRVYSRALTSNERMQNYKVDKKRFNLA